MEHDEDSSQAAMRLSVQKLSLAAEYYSGICAGMARFFTKEIQKVTERIKLKGLHSRSNTDTCRYCGSLFRPGNSSFKLLHTLKLNKRLTRILGKAERRGVKSLSALQRRLCKMYASAGTRLGVTCHCCEKRSIKLHPDPQYRIHKRDKTEKTEGITSLTKSQKKKMKKKKRLRQTQGNSEPLVRENTNFKASERSQTLKLDKVPGSHSKKYIVKQPQHTKTLHQILGSKTSTPATFTASKKKKLTALGKLLDKEKNEQQAKSSGGGLADFLSSLK